MAKLYNDRNTVRLVEKTGMVRHNFKGHHMDDIIDGMAVGHRCRLCGQPMTPYKDYYNIIIWKCDTKYCPNNPNSPLKFDIDANFINYAGNTEKKWDNWMPRKLV